MGSKLSLINVCTHSARNQVIHFCVTCRDHRQNFQVCVSDLLQAAVFRTLGITALAALTDSPRPWAISTPAVNRTTHLEREQTNFRALLLWGGDHKQQWFSSPVTCTDLLITNYFRGFPWLSGKEPACQCRRHVFDSWGGKIPWRRKWQSTPEFLPEKFHAQRSLEGYSSWDCKQSHTTE